MKTKSAAFSKILNYFLQGLLLTVPITVTLVVLVQAIIWIDGLLPIHIPITIPSIPKDGLSGNTAGGAQTNDI